MKSQRNPPSACGQSMKKNVNWERNMSIHFSLDAGLKTEVVDEFLDCLNKLISDKAYVHVKKPLFVPCKKGLQQIRKEDVVYLEAERNCCTIHFITGDSLLVCTPLATISGHFLNDNFIRIHRSYVINMEYLDFLIGNTATLKNGTQLTVSKAFRKEIYKHFEIMGTRSLKLTSNPNS